MIRWFCDVCEQEIRGEVEQVVAYSATPKRLGINRELVGCGEPRYFMRTHACEACAEVLRREIGRSVALVRIDRRATARET